MNQEAFIDWALDNARTVEERFTVEILVEFVMFAWHIKHKTGCHDDFRAGMERDRQRYLNPAYVPGYSEDDLRHAVEIWVEKKSGGSHCHTKSVPSATSPRCNSSRSS